MTFNRRQLIPPTIIIAAVAIAAFLGSIKQSPDKPPETTQAPVVEIHSIFPQNSIIQIDSQGTVQPTVETTIMSEVSGAVSYVAPVFAAGGFFKKGDELLHLDPLNYEVRLQQAQASLALASARLKEETARSKAEKDRWVASGKSLDKAPPLLIRTPYIEEAKANVKAAKAELRQAETLLEKTRVTAPYDGLVKTRQANLGQFISLGANLGTLVKTDKVEVRLPVTASALPFLESINDSQAQNKRLKVEITARFGQEKITWPAEIVRREGVIDPQNRLHYFIALIDDPYALTQANASKPILTVGSFVQAKIYANQLENIYVVPRKLLRRNNELLVIEDNQYLKMRSVNVIYSTSEKTYIDTGLSPGDQLVVSEISNPIEGTLVQIKDASRATMPNITAEGMIP